jgi:alpha-L-fucosidase
MNDAQAGPIDRRVFLLGAASAAGLGACRGVSPPPAAPVPGLPTPRGPQLAWQRAEFGVVFHYDLHVFDERRYVQAENRRRPLEDPSIFDPPALDTDQWVAAAAAAGARFAILTASHETGFRLWSSDANPFSVRAAPWRGGRGDLLADFVASCRRHGLEPGVYLGARWNAQLGVLDFRVQPGAPLDQAAYNRLIEREVEEVCTRYGPLFELWFDGGILTPQDGGPDVLPIFERHQPDCLYYHSDQRADARWGGTESGTVGDPCWSTIDLAAARSQVWDARQRTLLRHGDPEGADWCPAMADAPIRNHEWFWEPGDEHKLYPAEDLVRMWFESVGRNATLILGAMPDRRGLIPDADLARLQQMGRGVRAALGEVVAESSGHGDEVGLHAATPFDVVDLSEQIEHGERIRRYIVEVRTGMGDWVPIAQGTCVGQRRIHRLERPTAGEARLRVTASVGPPVLRRIALRRSRRG